tara:strand:- start:34 stop:1161 length:1128 start_codon:yes stop_codon:yes gene_type:complete
MSKLKIMSIVGTRPEIIRLSRILPKLEENFNHMFVHTGQNYDYELEKIFYGDLNISKPKKFLNCAGNSYAETISKVIKKVDELILKENPDAILILGDTNSSLAAIPAKRRKIPIFHMEAGNRCFDFRVPEEVNRKIVDHISDINLPYSQIAKNHLLSEGFPSDRIIVTGSPMKEVLDFYKETIEESKILSKLGLEEKKFFLVSSHREENVDNPHNLKKLLSILSLLTKKYNHPVIFSTHPRTKVRLKELNISIDKKIKFLKPFSFTEYIKLQTSAKCVLSDSGTITEESSILGFPALNIRETHERQEGFEEAAVMLVGLNPERILQAVNYLEKYEEKGGPPLKIAQDYTIDNVSEKLVRIIPSYIDYVNKYVWHR